VKNRFQDLPFKRNLRRYIEVARWAAHYEHRLQEGQKPIIHLVGAVRVKSSLPIA
jgi:hypothetical protein